MPVSSKKTKKLEDIFWNVECLRTFSLYGNRCSTQTNADSLSRPENKRNVFPKERVGPKGSSGGFMWELFQTTEVFSQVKE